MTPLERLIECYEKITPERVTTLASLYAPDAYFKDPFNEVTGQAAIERIFTHMFVQVDTPHFKVIDRFEGESGAMLAWEFRFQSGSRERLIRGVTHLKFDADGKVSLHRDYWDAAEELYSKVPVLGWLMCCLQRALRA